MNALAGQHQLVTSFASPLVVALAGDDLVAAAPSGPVQVVLGRVAGRHRAACIRRISLMLMQVPVTTASPAVTLPDRDKHPRLPPRVGCISRMWARCRLLGPWPAIRVRNALQAIPPSAAANRNDRH